MNTSSFLLSLLCASFRVFQPCSTKIDRRHKRDSARGFRERGERGPKQPGNQEHDAKKSMEQEAEENNLGSMEHRI